MNNLIAAPAGYVVEPAPDARARNLFRELERCFWDRLSQDKAAAKVRFAIEEEINLDWKDERGRALLHMAARHNLHKASKVLLKAGADVDVRWDSRQATPLHLAINAKSPQLVQVLLKAGADVSLRFKTPRRPERSTLFIADSMIEHCQSVVWTRTKPSAKRTAERQLARVRKVREILIQAGAA